MRDRHRHVNVRPYLPQALLATAAVVGLPLLAVFALVGALDSDPHPFLVGGFALLIAVVVAGLGMLIWKSRPESADIAFGELLIWGWLQRKRADDRLDEGAALLGLDRSGHPTQAVRITPERQLDVLKDLNEALEGKDPYTHGHSQRVERHSYRTAAAMGLSVAEIEELRLAAALHDVGKIRVPDRVLRKPGKLTKEERTIIEEHVVVGAWMVSNVGSADVVATVRHHHERWDGHGYPDGLAGSDIPLFARIVAVADAYDAITSTRPYRVSAGREHAVSILRSEAGSQFDPMIVNAFVDALPIRLPVAGALLILAGPVALGRKMAMWLKRFGAGHVAPAAATLGAVVTLGAFMPSAPPPQLNPAPPVAVEQVSQPSAPLPVSLPRTAPDQKEEKVVEPAAEKDVVLGTRVERKDRRSPAPAPAKVESPAKPEPKPAPGAHPAEEPEESDGSDQPGCTDGPKGQGRESSEDGRERAREASDGRGPNHC